VKAYDIHEDPYIELILEASERAVEAESFVKTRKTFCGQQLEKFLERSFHMYVELGGWAVDHFIQASIDQLRRSIENDGLMTRLDRAERVYLLVCHYRKTPRGALTSPQNWRYCSLSSIKWIIPSSLASYLPRDDR
jgi:hypothetical protein